MGANVNYHGNTSYAVDKNISSAEDDYRPNDCFFECFGLYRQRKNTKVYQLDPRQDV